MTTPRLIRTELAILTRLTETTQARIPKTLHTLTDALNHLDGYPHTASGADTGPPGHSDSSSVERTTLTRLNPQPPGPATALADLYDYLHTARHALQLALTECDRHNPPPTHADYTRLRCAGDPLCSQIADPRRNDGQCTDCGRTTDLANRAYRDRSRYHAERRKNGR